MPSVTPILTTARLVLRPLRLEDAPMIQVVFPHWEIVCYMTTIVPWPYPADGAITFIRDVALPSVAAGDSWYWSIFQHEVADRLIGLIRLGTGAGDNRSFWLATEWQGRGLMTEAVTVTTDYWFGDLGQDVLRVAKAVGNTASRCISERQGMRLVGMDERSYIAGRLQTEIWELSAEEWRARRR